VIIDIDKTAIGAKGRNDKVIDRARLAGIYRTMDSVLGDDFDRRRSSSATTTNSTGRAIICSPPTIRTIWPTSAWCSTPA
jgi:hypothetical protein